MADAGPHPDLATILEAAYGAGDGAYAWRKKDLPEVLETLAAAGLAVVGGEVWGLRDFEILGAVPTRRGHTRILAWSARDKSPQIGWDTFCIQCARYALQSVRELNAEKKVTPAFRDHLVYHLHFLAEGDYLPPKRKTL